MTSPQSPSGPSRREQFDLLFSAQIRFHDRFVDSGFKVAAALTVFLGWLLSANAAKEFLQGAPFALWLTCLLTGALGTWLILFNFFRAQKETNRLFSKLSSLQYFDESFLTQYQLSPRLFWSVLALNAVLCILLLGGMIVVRLTSVPP